MKTLRITVIVVAFMFTAKVNAADLFQDIGYCRFVEDATRLVDYSDLDELRDEVDRLYNHAAEVSNSRSTIFSATPLFTWANEAKISCAKALGYLKRRWIWRPEFNDEMLQKCDCFYSRMTHYLH